MPQCAGHCRQCTLDVCDWSLLCWGDCWHRSNDSACVNSWFPRRKKVWTMFLMFLYADVSICGKSDDREAHNRYVSFPHSASKEFLARLETNWPVWSGFEIISSSTYRDLYVLLWHSIYPTSSWTTVWEPRVIRARALNGFCTNSVGGNKMDPETNRDKRMRSRV